MYYYEVSDQGWVRKDGRTFGTFVEAQVAAIRNGERPYRINKEKNHAQNIDKTIVRSGDDQAGR